MYYPNSGLINQLERQKDNIDNLLQQYTGQNITPIGIEARFTEEDVSNIPVMRKTLFINERDKKISIKEIDGTISKEYEIVVPLDEKDKKILELERRIKEMEYERTKPIKSNDECKEPNTNDDANVDTRAETNGK